MEGARQLSPHLALDESGQLGERQGRPVSPAHEQALQNDLVELGVRAPDEEAVELQGGGGGASGRHLQSHGALHALYLDEQPQVHILAPGRDPGNLLVAATGLEINTLAKRKRTACEKER